MLLSQKVAEARYPAHYQNGEKLPFHRDEKQGPPAS